jgi:hypothetical protein
MASRMIHYTVANLVMDKIDFNNENQLLVGSLAPDMTSDEADRNAKRRAHFYEILEKLGVKGYNWFTFYQKYLKQNVDDEFALGYFMHLICDNIWLTDIYAKYIHSLDKEIRRENIIKGYEDMRKCNYHIAKNYDINFDTKPLDKFVIDEADILYQMSLLEGLKQDFLPYGDNFDLEIHNWNAITDYISKCVDVCLKEVNLVKNGKEPDSPIPYWPSIGYR